VILAEADIAAGDPLRATLAEDDVACDDGFTAEFLDAEALALAVATVFDGTLSFFMGHKGGEGKGLGVDGGDLHKGQRLAMTTGFVEALALAEFEGGGLVGLVLLEHFGGNAGTSDRGSSHFDAAAFTSDKHLVEGGGVALGSRELLDVELVAHGDFVLFAASFDDCVCHNLKK